MRRERELRRAAPIAQGGFVLLDNRGSDERIDPESRGARDERKAAVEKHITAVAREDIALVARLLRSCVTLLVQLNPPVGAGRAAASSAQRSSTVSKMSSYLISTTVRYWSSDLPASKHSG